MVWKLRLARLTLFLMPAVALVVATVLVALPAASDEDVVVPTRVSLDGATLVRGGEPWQMRIGSIYHGLDAPGEAIARVGDLGLNTVRITDFLDTAGSPATAAYDEASWQRVDRTIAAAAAVNIAVLLDLSSYRNLLAKSGVNPYTTDWQPFLRFVIDRRNTATGVRYGDDPTIALVSFAGEPDPIKNSPSGSASKAPTVPDPAELGLTSSQLTDFYRTVEDFYYSMAPQQLLTSGGLLYLDWDSGIDGNAILALPHNDVFSIHVYSQDDVLVSMPSVAAQSRYISKPWIVEEWGSPASVGDDERAALFTDALTRSQRDGAQGFGIWNVGTELTDTHDIGPQFPAIYAAVKSWGS